MTSERETGAREITRRLRDELARIRTAEAQVEQALQSVRGARRRVEELALSLEMDESRVRELVREEIAAVGAPPARDAEPAAGRAAGPAGLPWRNAPEERSRWSRPAGAGAAAGAAAAGAARHAEASRLAGSGGAAASAGEATADAPGRRERRRLALVAVAAALTVVVVGWLAFRGLRDGVVPGPMVLSDDAGAPAEERGDVAAEGQEEEEGAPPAGEEAGAGPLVTLPPSPEARQQLYDSLFAARSALFAPLLDSVAALTDDRDVEGAVEAWGGDGDLGAKDRDLVQSALVQWILKREIDQRVEVDGELLRNPCRGTSCSALLNMWQMGREAFGFPEMPDDAPTNADLLHTVEAMVVLERMQDLHVGEGVAVGQPRDEG